MLAAWQSSHRSSLRMIAETTDLERLNFWATSHCFNPLATAARMAAFLATFSVGRGLRATPEYPLSMAGL
jgi:hypothetical protein